MMGRRFVAGVGQLLLAVPGFLMVCGWFLHVIWEFYQLINDSNASPQIRYQNLMIGAAIFLLSWVWAWFTSISLLHEANRNEREGKLLPKIPVPPPL